MQIGVLLMGHTHCRSRHYSQALPEGRTRGTTVRLRKSLPPRDGIHTHHWDDITNGPCTVVAATIVFNEAHLASLPSTNSVSSQRCRMGLGFGGLCSGRHSSCPFVTWSARYVSISGTTRQRGAPTGFTAWVTVVGGIGGALWVGVAYLAACIDTIASGGEHPPCTRHWERGVFKQLIALPAGETILIRLGIGARATS